MKKKKVVIISVIAVLIAVGVYVLTNDKLRLKLGLPVKYVSDREGEEFNLVMSVLNGEKALSVEKDGILSYIVVLEMNPSGVLTAQMVETNEGQLNKIAITNEVDKAKFIKLLS